MGIVYSKFSEYYAWANTQLCIEYSNFSDIELRLNTQLGIRYSNCSEILAGNWLVEIQPISINTQLGFVYPDICEYLASVEYHAWFEFAGIRGLSLPGWILEIQRMSSQRRISRLVLGCQLLMPFLYRLRRLNQ